MSELAIGLVAEGPTDFVIIEAALRACLKRPFVLTLQQPEATRPEMQGGWGGVYKYSGPGTISRRITWYYYKLITQAAKISLTKLDRCIYALIRETSQF